MKPNVDQSQAPKAKPNAPAGPKTKTPESTTGPKPDAKDDLKSLPLAEVEKKLGSSPDGLTQAEPGPEAGSKPDAKAEPKPEAKVEPKAETKAKTPADLTAQLVKRVHKLYEDVGREEVRAVEDWEKTERESRKAVE